MYVNLSRWNVILIHSFTLLLLRFTHWYGILLLLYLSMFWTVHTMIIFIQTTLTIYIFHILAIGLWNLWFLYLIYLLFWWTLERHIFLRCTSVCVYYLINLTYRLGSWNAWILIIAIILLIVVGLLIVFMFLC